MDFTPDIPEVKGQLSYEDTMAYIDETLAAGEPRRRSREDDPQLLSRWLMAYIDETLAEPRRRSREDDPQRLSRWWRVDRFKIVPGGFE